MSTLAMPTPSKPLAPSVFAGKAWQQVLARDPRADGQFVYAVKSTGVYCRPTCPSRRPERKNVSFFPGPAQAEAAGFRACLRCEPSRIAPRPDPQAAAIARAAELLSSGSRPSLDQLAAAAGLGKFALQRGFKRVLGVTPGEFAREARKKRLHSQLKQPKQTITTAIYEAGFGSSSRLYEHVDATLGMSPTAMKAGGAGETIRYALADSALGRVLVATTDRGLCAVLFADSDAEAAVDLRERFPQAVHGIEGGEADLLDFAIDVFSFAAGFVERNFLHEEIFCALLDDTADTGKLWGKVRKHSPRSVQAEIRMTKFE